MQLAGQMSCSYSKFGWRNASERGPGADFCRIKQWFQWLPHIFQERIATAAVNSLFLVIPVNLNYLLFIQIISTLPGWRCQKSHSFKKVFYRNDIMLWS